MSSVVRWERCGHRRTTNNTSAKGGCFKCAGAGGRQTIVAVNARKSGRPRGCNPPMTLDQKRARDNAKLKDFRCGHPVEPANVRMAGKYRRCITCDHTRAERKAQGTTKQRQTHRGIPQFLHLDPVVLTNFAPVGLPVRDDSGRSYDAFPKKQRFA